jgi:predicted MFS family arabinose efflux permease
MSAAQVRSETRSELVQYWPIIVACFATAIFGWGFGFTGPSIYLSDLHRLHGWPTAQISYAITLYYLLGAVCMTQVHVALRRFGPARVLAGGVVLLGLGATLFSRSQQLWQTFAAAGVMAVGWAGCTSTAIAASLALFFQRQRGFAITLALNGASAAGFTVGPALIALSLRLGFPNAVPLAAVLGLSVALPLIWLAFPKNGRIETTTESEGKPSGQIVAVRVLGSWSFWSVGLPFALALAAQVGLIVHLVSMVLPALGPSGSAWALALTSFAAMAGRLLLAGVIDQLPRRPAAALSIGSQACGLALMMAFPTWPAALYAGCVIFGLSVGNVITYPALIVQQEFSDQMFSRVIGLSTAVGQFAFALSPALLGLIHDGAESYTPVLAVCVGLQLAAALLVARRPLLKPCKSLDHGASV